MYFRVTASLQLVDLNYQLCETKSSIGKFFFFFKITLYVFSNSDFQPSVLIERCKLVFMSITEAETDVPLQKFSAMNKASAWGQCAMVICVYYTQIIPQILYSIFNFTHRIWTSYLLIAKHCCGHIYNHIQISKLPCEKDVLISNQGHTVCD